MATLICDCIFHMTCYTGYDLTIKYFSSQIMCLWAKLYTNLEKKRLLLSKKARLQMNMEREEITNG